jgi:hypothetical protein
MAVAHHELEGKLREMYPEIVSHGFTLSLDFDVEKNAWKVKLQKDRHELMTYLEKKDAEDCLDGIECIYLGVQIGQFIKNFGTA